MIKIKKDHKIAIILKSKKKILKNYLRILNDYSNEKTSNIDQINYFSNKSK